MDAGGDRGVVGRKDQHKLESLEAAGRMDPHLFGSGGAIEAWEHGSVTRDYSREVLR